MNSLSISHVQGLFSPEHGGPTYSTGNYCFEQRRLGHRVNLRVLEGYPNSSPARRLEGIDQKVFPVAWPSRLGRSRDLEHGLTNDLVPDIYHLHGAWLMAMKVGADIARRHAVPYVVELMGSFTEYELKRKWLRKAVARLAYQDKVLETAACLHVNSRLEGEMLRRLGFKAPIACLPVGVDLSSIRRLAKNPENGRQGSDRPYMLYLGRIHPTKGIDELILAWEKISPGASNCRLVIAGTGEPVYVERCKKLSENLERNNSCVWLGTVSEEEKVKLYCGALAYILPSRNENFGNTVAEALACGTPVITTSNTQWTMIEQRECGWLAEPQSESLAQAILRCLDSGEDERRRRGALGRKMVEEEYSIEVVVRNLIEIYRGILAGDIPPRFLI